MPTARLTDVCAARHVEEWSTEENFKRCILDHLDLKIDGNWSHLHRKILDKAHCQRWRGVCSFQIRCLAQRDRNSQLLPNITSHDDNLRTTIENALDLNTRTKEGIDDAERKAGNSRRRGGLIFLKVDIGEGRNLVGKVVQVSVKVLNLNMVY